MNAVASLASTRKKPSETRRPSSFSASPAAAASAVAAIRAVERGELPNDALARFPQLIIAPMLVGIVWHGLFDKFEPLDVAALEAWLSVRGEARGALFTNPLVGLLVADVVRVAFDTEVEPARFEMCSDRLDRGPGRQHPGLVLGCLSPRRR